MIGPGADVFKIVSGIPQEVDRVMEKGEARVECCEVHVLAAILPVPSLDKASVGKVEFSEEPRQLGLDSKSHMADMAEYK